MITLFEGQLTEADHKGHVPLSFDVPPGTTRLTGHFRASPQRASGAFYDNLISLSLFGPMGARGARHNNPDMDFRIEAQDASPGYLPGPIEPGRWTVFLDCFRVLGPDPLRYSLRLTCDDAPVSPAAPRRIGQTAPRGPGWYRGDLHAHSLHSDGSWDIPDLIGWARRRGLDFVTLTDHNTVSGHAEALSLADDSLLVMGGMELTTHHGHALSLGRRQWCEWRSGPVTGRSMADLAQAAMASGASFVIAHPMAPGDPACTGCRWDHADMRPGPAGLVELWNGGPWSDYNEEGLHLYQTWLAQGHRLRVTAGTDIHGPDGDVGRIGFNHVEAAALTEAAVLAAIGAGRNYLSSGPKLILTAQGPDGTLVHMGQSVTRPATLHADWATDDIGLILSLQGPDGCVVRHALPAHGQGCIALADLPHAYVMADLRDATGRVHALSNPIFIDG